MSVETEAARRALLTLLGYEGGIRAGAILDRGGEVLASTAEISWAPRLAASFAAVERGREAAAVEVAIATVGGELIAVRDRGGAGRTAAALVDRHALGSLVSSDLRAALRQVEEAAA